MKRTIAATTLVVAIGLVLAIVPSAHPARASLLELRDEQSGPENGQIPVHMALSGSAVNTQIKLQPDAGPAGDVTLAGNGSLGAFTYHEVEASAAVPSGTCGGPNTLEFPVKAGAGVFRFQDGALLTTKITEGSVCVDLSIPEASVTASYQITGGTGRFKNASGTLEFTAKSDPVLFDETVDPVEPVFFAVHSGKTTGTIVLSNRNKGQL